MILPIQNPSGKSSSPQGKPLFVVGQVIEHKRYGYRGVIVDFDTSCNASEQWYQKNQTKPNRHQPWYHVLVHDTHITTYAAQTSLTATNDLTAITHPLIEMFFDGFDDGLYLRNDVPWPN
jgi:heat shock protein HspQ